MCLYPALFPYLPPSARAPSSASAYSSSIPWSPCYAPYPPATCYLPAPAKTCCNAAADKSSFPAASYYPGSVSAPARKSCDSIPSAGGICLQRSPTAAGPPTAAPSASATDVAVAPAGTPAEGSAPSGAPTGGASGTSREPPEAQPAPPASAPSAWASISSKNGSRF